MLTDVTPIAVDLNSLEDVISRVVAEAAEKIYQANQGGLAVSRAWVYQRPEQIAAMGGRAPWYVAWIDPDGKQRSKSCGSGVDGKRNAGKLRRKVEAELLTDTYGKFTNKTWEEFRREYEAKILSGKSIDTRRQALMSLANFERIVKPGRVSQIKTATIAAFTAKRRQEPARYTTDRQVAPASVNVDLRNIKAALNVAIEWGWLKELPKFRMEREPEKLPLFVTAEHFGAIYLACDKATLPHGSPAPDWWRAFLVTAYLTGWRKSELLGLRRHDVDLEAGLAITRWENNKGKRDEAVKLHPFVVDHLKKLPGFTETVFPWPHNHRTLWDEFYRLQTEAKIELIGRKPRYTLHDLRRAFGTLNAATMAPRVLQQLMRHKSLQTTLRYYCNPMAEMEEAVSKLKVPDVLKVSKIA